MKTKYFKTLLFVCIIFIGCNKNESVIDESNQLYEKKLTEKFKLTRLDKNDTSVNTKLKFASFKEAYAYITNNLPKEKKVIKKIGILKTNTEVNNIKSNSVLTVKKSNNGSHFQQYSIGPLYEYLFWPEAPILVTLSCSPNLNYSYSDDGMNNYDSKIYFYYQTSSYGLYDINYSGSSVQETGESITGGSFTSYLTQTYTVEIGGNYYNLQRNIEVQGSISFNVQLPQYEVPSSIDTYLSISATVL
ncbi:MAG TPA: hypothetical protein DHW64_06595 [Chitinophagaceae bacterium]|nr:hypothetical protein [Chitinophagaceae bacterium]